MRIGSVRAAPSNPYVQRACRAPAAVNHTSGILSQPMPDAVKRRGHDADFY